MEWLRRNYKTVVGTLIILILIEAVVAWYLIDRFRENYLSGDEAFTAVLEDASLSRDAVGTPKIKLETEKGEAWYEVTFTLTGEAGATYRYRVNAETGEILSAERE